ncbi:MAG: FAD-binding oxidoreductase [Parvibaculaceae bacterium]
MTASDLITRLQAIVGDTAVTTNVTDMMPYLEERRGLYHGQAAAIVRPASTAEVSAVMKLAFETGTVVVPQGGNTGLVGGQIPDESGDAIILNLSRMATIREVDAQNNTLSVDAGVTLADAQAAADDASRFFPLSLASEGTCQIGGNLATNAGGTAVLHYGNARDLVLGLEIVLADGRIWDGMRSLRKDNTGYDLKQIFLGSEGTLGIITGAVLKLFPKPASRATAFAAVPGPAEAVSLLRQVEASCTGAVTSFELMPRAGIEMVLAHVPGTRDPLAEPAKWYVLIEATAGATGARLGDELEAALARAMTDGLVSDAVVAQSDTQSAELWQLREAMSDAQRPEGGSIKHDVSVPVSRIALFIERALQAVHAEMPGIRPVPFGHIGDGNIHFNLSQPQGMDKDAFLARWTHFNAIVHGIALELGGSISAEHGIGQLKRDEMAALKSDVELDLMRSLKQVLDPKNILNPGKVIAV